MHKGQVKSFDVSRRVIPEMVSERAFSDHEVPNYFTANEFSTLHNQPLHAAQRLALAQKLGRNYGNRQAGSLLKTSLPASALNKSALQRTPAPPAIEGATGVLDPAKIQLDSIADIIISEQEQTAPRTIHVKVKAPKVVHISWELYDPNDKLLPASFSVPIKSPKPISQPFILDPATIAGDKFVEGRYTLRCTGYNVQDQPIYYAERVFNIEKEPKLLSDFADKFPEAAKLIRNSPSALKLVKEASSAGVYFGGFTDEVEGDTGWPYTAGKTVYLPKSHTDKVVAMSDFLFELNNGIRQESFAKIDEEGAKGSKGKLTAKEYAYKKVELEVEGMLRLGEVWFETKKTIGGGKALSKYDKEYYLSMYQNFKAGKITKEDIIKGVLKGVYSEGVNQGKTAEQTYMEEYTRISRGK
jgi:hypothetical protein